MNGKAGPAGLLLLAVALLTLALGAPAASGDTTDIIQPQTPESFDSGFQSGTCTEDSEAGLPPEGPPPKRCSVETPGLFFDTAAGHAPVGFTQYIIEHEPYELIPGPAFLAPIPGEDIKEHTIRTLRTDLPPGLTVNPEATPSRCSLAEFLNEPEPGLFVPTCDASTRTGTQKITLVTNKDEVEIDPENLPGFKPPKGFVIPPIPGGTEIPVYNLVPAEGEPAKLGFVVNGRLPVFLTTQVAWESDFHESFTISLPNTAELTGLSTLVSRLVTNGATTGDGTYLTSPTSCFDPNLPEHEHLYSTWFRAESYADEPNPNFPAGVTPVEGPLPKEPPNIGQRVQPEGCDTIPFDPSIEVDPGTNDVDSPAGATVTTKLPFDPVAEGGAANQSQSHVRRSEVSLPKGMGLNPSGSNGLVACTDAQFKKGQRVEANECPAASVVGTVEIDSPPLAEPLEGEVYVGEQKSQDPQSGDLFRILIEAKSAHEGIFTRLVGNVKANPVTGELTAVLTDKIVGQFAGTLPDGLPQVPFESVKLHFEGSKETLTSPPTCSTHNATSQFEPWARPGTFESSSDGFTLTNAPGGGACPKTMAERAFSPGYSAEADNRKAGSYTPLRVKFVRPQGQQELKAVDVTLPEGLTGRLAGIPYCPDTAIGAAVYKSGVAEQSSPSCASASQIGNAVTTSGTGDNPLKLGGKVYLAGPYKGGALSLLVITPAVSGPFDLGTVVTRAAIHVDPVTAQVRTVSDPIPDVFGGVKLDIREIAVDLDRQQFMRTPTNCGVKSIDTVMNGGGGDPTNPATWSSYAASVLFGALDCRALKFKPKLFTRILGGKRMTKRAKNPKFRAVLIAREGDANIKRSALTLPRAVILDQGHIRTVCTRVQLAAGQCPRSAIYGHARAITPLLDGRLKGPVYLVSSTHKLPDLVADLRGQVDIRLHGVISSKRGGIKTVFNAAPDVPVKKFILTMRGGRRGLLVNTTNLCTKKRFSFLNIKGHNSRRVRSKKHRLTISGCKKKKRKRGGRR